MLFRSPLKIAFPNLELVLADSLNTRIKFLNQVIDELELKDITAVHARAEELGRNKDYREQFDVCVSRAVANLSSLSEYCIPFVKVGGKFISYKSGSIEEEVAEAKKAVFVLGGKVTDVYKLELDTILEHGENKVHKVEVRLTETHEDDAVPFYLVSVIGSSEK